MKEILSKANKYVQRLETDWLSRVAENVSRWKHKSSACGCPSCRAGFEMRQRVMYEERRRLYGWHPDLEEEWVLDYAIRRMLENKDDV